MDEDRERELLRRRLLGFGLAAERVDPALGDDPLGRDLTLVETGAGRDLATVAEVENLGQALQIALTTRFGDDVFNTGFGFDGLNALVEEANPVIARERVRVAVIQLLRRDPRVRRVVDLQLGGPPPGAEGETPLQRSRTLEVRVVFETIAGGEVSVDLTGAVGGA